MRATCCRPHSQALETAHQTVTQRLEARLRELECYALALEAKVTAPPPKAKGGLGHAPTADQMLKALKVKAKREALGAGPPDTLCRRLEARLRGKAEEAVAWARGVDVEVPKPGNLSEGVEMVMDLRLQLAAAQWQVCGEGARFCAL